MKTRLAQLLLAGLALSAGIGPQVSAATTRSYDNITVVFQDPDNFTDARESHSNFTSTASRDELHNYVQQTAARFLPAESKLTVTFIDLDLAGMIRPDKDNIRVMNGVTPPRAHVKFQLLAADGQTIKEGERKLSDMNYQQSMHVAGRNDPLVYDKQLLKDWIEKEFKKTS